VGVFRSIVEPFVLPMLHARQDLAFRCPIASQLISNDHAWDVLQFSQELTEKSFGSLFIASALHQDIQHVTILIYCSPQIMLLAPDRKENFVHVPFVPTARATTAQFIRVGLPKLQTPLPDRFIGDDDSALGQKLFHVTKAERETERQPHRMADDFRREAETLLIGYKVLCFHEGILAYCSALSPS
jgi:hypothetical protein